MAQPIDIAVRVLAELDAVSDVADALSGIEQIPEELKKSFEKLYSVPDELEAMTRRYQELVDNISKSRESGDEAALRMAEKELLLIGKKIDLEERLLRLRMDSSSVFAQELIPQVESANMSAEQRGDLLSMISPEAMAERADLLKGRYEMLEAGVDITKAESRLARAGIGGGESGADDPAKVKWSVIQSSIDEIVRGITRGITQGLKAGIGIGLDRAIGGSSIMGIAQGALNEKDIEDILGSPAGAALGLGTGGTTGGEAFWTAMDPLMKSTALTKQQIAGMAGDATGWFEGSDKEMGDKEMGNTLKSLWGLTQYGISPDTAGSQGAIASLLTGGEGTGASGIDSLLENVIPMLGGARGRSLESMLQMVQQFAGAGGAVSGDFGTEGLAQAAAMPSFFFKDTNYENYMLGGNAQNAGNFMNQLSAPFEGGGGDATNAFLMRAYGYEGSGIEDYADFTLRTQQGFKGERGFENLQDVMGRLELESGTRSPKALALQMSNITNIPMAQLLPMIEKMQTGDFAGARALLAEEYEYDPGKAKATDTAAREAQAAGMRSDLGDPLLKLMEELTAIISELLRITLPGISKVLGFAGKVLNDLNPANLPEKYAAAEKTAEELLEEMKGPEGSRTPARNEAMNRAQKFIDKNEPVPPYITARLLDAYGIDKPPIGVDRTALLGAIGMDISFGMPLSPERKEELEMEARDENARGSLRARYQTSDLDFRDFKKRLFNIVGSGVDEKGKGFIQYGTSKEINIQLPTYILGSPTTEQLERFENVLDESSKKIRREIIAEETLSNLD